MSDASIWAPGTDVPLVTNVANTFQAFVATAGQTLFTLTDFVYVPASGSVRVTVNGVMQVPVRDFTETSETEVTLTFTIDADDDVVIWGVTSAEYSVAAQIAVDAAAAAAVDATAADASAVAAAASAATAATASLYAGEIAVDTFDGTGAQTAFTLSIAPPDETALYVYVHGVYQSKATFSVSGTTLTFSAAPPAGTGNVEIITHVPSVVTGQYVYLDAVQTLTNKTFTGLTVAGGNFTSRGITDAATAPALTLSGSGARYVTIANDATNPSINTSAGQLLLGAAGTHILTLSGSTQSVTVASAGAGITNLLVLNKTGTAMSGTYPSMIDLNHATFAGGNAFGIAWRSSSRYDWMGQLGTSGRFGLVVNYSGTPINAWVVDGSGNVSLGGDQGSESLRVVPVSGGNRWVTITGSNGSNPTIGASAGTLSTTGNFFIDGLLTVSNSVMLATDVAFFNGAGVGAGTLTNAPAAGNPTKWIQINDNGTTRHIPAW